MRGTRKSSVKKSGLSRSFLRRLRLLEPPSLLRPRGMVMVRVAGSPGRGEGQAVQQAGWRCPPLFYACVGRPLACLCALGMAWRARSFVREVS